MVRIAGERIADLFALAEREAVASHGDLAHRYVVLARKVGMRYNVRLLREYRELYCRTCSVFWVEGRTVRTRLRSGRRIRTCLACGRERRTPVRPSQGRTMPGLSEGVAAASRREGPPLVVAPETSDDELGDEEGEEE
jgi:ribonuclease P protein subunit RPR2